MTVDSTIEVVRLPGDRAEAVAGLDSLGRRLEHSSLAGQAIAIMAQGLVIAPAALAPITQDPFAPTSMLVRATGDHADLRVRHHLVTSVGTGFHEVTAPDHRSVGALRIASADGPAAVAAIANLREALATGEVTTTGSDLLELVAVALVRSSITVRAVPVVDVPWFRDPSDVDTARAETGAVSDERIARLQANRLDDGFYSTFVVRKLSKPMTRFALRLGLSPNSITLASFAIGTAAAACFALGARGWLVLGAVLLQLSLVVDCVDGEVARATRKFSALGAWLDASTDRVKEFLAYAGLAIGAMRYGIDIWWLAIALVLLQTTRHMSDYDFSRVQRLREAYVPERDLGLRDDGAAGSAGGWSVGGAMEMSTRMNRRDAVRWAKRAIHMPIGERWLVISLGAALLGATWAMGILLALGLLAFCYVVLGRTMRTLSWRGSTPESGALLLARQWGGGPLVSGLSRLVPGASRVWAAPFGWAIPAALRAVELGVVAIIAWAWVPGAMVVSFWWMAVVAFHHYDVLYRAMQDSSTPRWITWGALGWDGRTILVLALALTGVLAAWLGWLALVLALLVVVAASIQWLTVQKAPR